MAEILLYRKETDYCLPETLFSMGIAEDID